ncbi:MAG: cation-translocating P-type ATPase [Magnetospirillum sp.]|nr:cation-translocating P-type ATPase [Magnetospirillum sp.]
MPSSTSSLDRVQSVSSCADECSCQPGSEPGSGASAVPKTSSAATLAGFSGRLLAAFGATLGVVVLLVVLAEWLGLLERLSNLVPWPFWLAGVFAGGYPIFWTVVRAALRLKVTSHTLMTVGLIAAIAVGQWPAAVIVVFFMRLADYIEQFTAVRARRAVQDLTAMAPERARVERDGHEVEVPVAEVRVGETVIVRPGEKIPVDGEVIGGQATVNQAAITGESMPVEAGPGARVFAASFTHLGHLRVRTTEVGSDTTFGHVIRLVENAEKHRAPVQRIADRFATWYLPVVAAIATATFVVSGNALATAAVLMVACSCSFAIATPVAMIASIGSAARRGLLIKGSKYVEALAKADVVLLDKTGTLTLGRPRITDVVPLDSRYDGGQLLRLAATAERYSEHPLAEAVRAAAAEHGQRLGEPEGFEAIPGQGVRVRIDGSTVAVGSRRLLADAALPSMAADLEAQGKTLLFVGRDSHAIGVLAAMDTLREEVPAALAELRSLGIKQIELLTGDNERTAGALARQLGIAYRANLLPEDKIAVVKEHQLQGRAVVMVGDGVNDAPALAQADVGIAMGAAGSGVAIEAAHIALMREDWSLVPEVIRIARRTMGVVKLNLGFTAVYNLTGLALAAIGVLPPVIAAAAQSGPDFGILANSARLLPRRQSGAGDGSGSGRLERRENVRDGRELRSAEAGLRPANS